MNDRELLELAAKAAGMKLVHAPDNGPCRGCQFIDGKSAAWNPLNVDGDALRLAVRLNINIMGDHGDGSRVAQWDDPSDETRSIWERQENGDDPCAATRRAIVLAAAEIGRSA
jgi:hypothetical protein